MADLFDQYAHTRPNSHPQIYVFEESGDPRFAGMVCVGYTTKENVEDRIKQEFKNAPIKQWTLLYTEDAMRDDGTTFVDYDVHKVLEQKQYQRLKSYDSASSEWFRCGVKDVKAAILAVKTRSANQENRTETFSMRDEQEKAVSMTEAYYKKEHAIGHTGKFLWNAKMRFGKTFTSYELAKRMKIKHILVMTFKPAVESAWQEDLLSHIDFEGWQFYSRDYAKQMGITPEELHSNLDENRPIVCFGSFQDFLGVDDNGGIKAKNEWVHATRWDLVIFDEYHFGAWRDTARKLFDIGSEDDYDNLDLEKYKLNEADNAYNESFLPITADYFLYLSGTPFRSLYSGEFIEEQIFSWTYTDEQRAKTEHSDEGDSNPYASLPQMIMMTYKMPDEIQRIAINTESNEFDLNTFFTAEVKQDKPVETAEFKYKDYVQKWLDMIRGAYMPTTIDQYKQGGSQKPVMPYSDTRMLNILTHTLWFLPNVASCYAMTNLLAERQNVFYHDYQINVCAGISAGVGLSALNPVRQSMEVDPSTKKLVGPLNTKTITLSCGKLTTGVTVKPWTGIFMLRNLSSPETYFQAAFRVQSPWIMKDEMQKIQILKRDCYIFDFALNRALTQIADYSCGLNVEEGNPEKRVNDFIHFLPVLAYDGSAMTEVDARAILDITMSGTSATMLARRWESALLVNVDNDTLLRILDNPEALEAIMHIEGFRSLNEDIKTIINKSEHVKKVKKDGETLTKEQKEKLDEEENEYKSKRKQIQEKLIKFATRIPIFMYLSDFREFCLKDVITQFEPTLFKRVTGLSTKDFEMLVSLGVFNDSVMNEAVYRFKLYEDGSLEYTGINKHIDDENVGLFSTIITKEDYEAMAAEQSKSMKVEEVVSSFTRAVQIPKVNPTVNEIHATALAARPVYAGEKEADNDVLDTLWIKPGAKIMHNRFGEGTVKKVFISEGKFLVKFGHEEKTLVMDIVVRRKIVHRI